MNDAIADMLNRISIGSKQGHRSVSVPVRKVTETVASVLESEGYILSYEKKGKKVNKYIDVEIRYIPKKTKSGKEEHAPALSGFRRLSKPSQRVYVGSRNIAPSKERGVCVLSTPLGVLTGPEAKKKGVGGELLFEVW